MKTSLGSGVPHVSMGLVLAVLAVSGCSSGYDPGGSGGGSSGGGSLCSSGSSGPKICLDRSTFSAGSPIPVHFSGGPAKPKDWIAVYPSGRCNPTCPSGSTLWQYCASNSQTAPGSGVSSGTVQIDSTANASSWPLSNGTWDMLYLVDDGYDPIAKVSFQITGGASCALAVDKWAATCSGGCGDVMACLSFCSTCQARCYVPCSTDADCSLVGAGTCEISTYASNRCSGRPTRCP